jgi:hypothetical protein
MRHYLDERGELPDLSPRALSVALFQGAIVAWVTTRFSPGMERTNVVCIRRSGRSRCVGEIEAGLDVEARAIVWRCPLCAESGYISGWLGSPWDRSLEDDDEDL